MELRIKKKKISPWLHIIVVIEMNERDELIKVDQPIFMYNI